MVDRVSAHKSKKGYTLVELMVALAVSLIVIAGIYNLYIFLHKTWLAEEIKAEMQQSARVAIDTMTRDMSMMGYGSVAATGKILVALPSELKFSEHLNEPTPAEYLIHYRLQSAGATWNLYRKLIKQSDDSEVRDDIIAQNVTNLTFKYYRIGVGAVSEEFTPADTQASRDTIRRIAISLKMRSARPMPQSDPSQPPRYVEITLTSDLTPRNLWEGEMAEDSILPSDVATVNVVDTGSCGTLKVKWSKATDNVGVLGYRISYGTTGGMYAGSRDVTVDSLSDPDNPEATISVDVSPYTTGGNSYYVTVLAYDHSHNYSAVTAPEVAAANPFPNITGFGQGGDDTTNNVGKPDAPAGLVVFGQYSSVTLSWTASTSPNVVGYRIYRKETAFASSDFPIASQPYPPANGQEIVQLSKETESGDGWAGPRSDKGGSDIGATFSYVDGLFSDKSTALVGCKTYYYAICAVTCDRTRIMGDVSHITENGGRYTSSQYATTSAAPLDRSGPSSPHMQSYAGYMRVFLSLDWPTDTDYAYSKIYFKRIPSDSSELPPAYDRDHPEYSDPYLIPDRQTGQAQGTFVNFGTSSVHDIIFNSEVANLLDDASPALEGAAYSFRCYAFDNCGNPSASVSGYSTTDVTLCGDDPCGAPSWPPSVTSRYVWVDANSSNLDASTWTTDDQRNITLVWTDVDTDDLATAKDFAGFRISKNVTESLTGADLLDTSQWDNYSISSGMNEGAVFYFGIQATDCLYQNMPNDGSTKTITCNEIDYVKTYDQIRSDNISAPFWSPPMKPGRLWLYTRTDTQSEHPEYNIASTAGTFHNRVKFYIQNTSQADLVLNSMNLQWDNIAARLKTLTIGPLDDGTTWTIPAGLGQNALTTISNIDATITNHATSTDTPSNAIPVTLEFVNADESVNSFDDMRNNTIVLEMMFTNNSMLSNSAGAVGVSGFTTGEYNGSNPLAINVTGGPSINYVRQNKPVSPTNPFEIDNRATDGTMPAGFPVLNGGPDTVVASNVTVSSSETISSVRVFYVQTDTSATSPIGQTFTPLTATASGNNYSATIPGALGKGVWYYVVANTAQGNTTRKPDTGDDSFYYYQTSTFDPCLEVPGKPTSLAGLPATLSWTAPAKYVSDADIDQAVDPLKYKVYRKVGLAGSFPVLPLISSLTSTSYNDTTYSNFSTVPVVYAVTAKNSCTTQVNESEKSDPLTVCPQSGSSACQITATPAVMYAGDTISVSVGVCAAANNGTSNQPGRIKAFDTPTLVDDDWFNFTEAGDTGTGSVSVPTTMKDSENTTARLRVIPAGQTSDTVVIEAATNLATNFLPAGCSTATVMVYANPCDNIPDEPTGLSGSLVSNKARLTWSLVTLNTDTSPATYTAPAPLSGDSIAGYEVWQSNANTDPNTSLTGWSKVQELANTATANNTSGSEFNIANNTRRWFTVRAIDTCATLNGKFAAPVSVTRGTP